VIVESGDSRSGPWHGVATLRTDRYGLFTRTLQVPATARTWLRARLVGSDAPSPAFSLTEPPDRQVNPFG
jgi:hypothetical protein